MKAEALGKAHQSAALLGMKPPDATVDQIRGGEIGRNRQIIENVLNGEPGPYRDIVVLNAAAALIAGDAATDFAGGIESARESLDSGNARERLEALVSVTQAA